MRYLFQLGHQPQISAAEIAAVFALHHFITSSPHHRENFLILDTDKQLDCGELMNTLGGTIKIAMRVNGDISTYLNKTQPTGKIVFSLLDKKAAMKIKKELRQAGRSVRYVEPGNTATIFYNNLIKSGGDLTIIGNEVLATQAIQPFEDFSARDYKRPSSDDKSGMLPPKLARILINLAQIPKNAAVLDPFCGSGTILTEAATMGYKNLIGSDISANAIVDSKQNLEWTNSTYHISHITYHLFHTQSAQLTKHIQPDSVNAIITEPTLGQPLTGGESKEKLQSQANELAKLYIESFKTFAKILKPDGVVLFIIPKFRFRNEWMGVDCVDKIKKTGFQTVPFQMFGSPPLDHLTYHRPNQHLARTIWKFIKV